MLFSEQMFSEWLFPITLSGIAAYSGTDSVYQLHEITLGFAFDRYFKYLFIEFVIRLRTADCRTQVPKDNARTKVDWMVASRRNVV